jgi:hypothetical protein
MPSMSNSPWMRGGCTPPLILTAHPADQIANVVAALKVTVTVFFDVVSTVMELKRASHEESPFRNPAGVPPGCLAQPQDLHCDVVRAAAFFCHLDQSVAGLIGMLSYDRVLNLRVVQQTPQTIGAEHQHIP